MKNLSFKIIILLTLTLFGCADLGSYGNDPYNSGGYRDPYYSGGRYDDDYNSRRERDRLRDKQRELDRERERLEEERERLRDDHYDAVRPEPIGRLPIRERCPSGFQETERKCTTEERRRGCKDMRMPGGLGCVSR